MAFVWNNKSEFKLNQYSFLRRRSRGSSRSISTGTMVRLRTIIGACQNKHWVYFVLLLGHAKINTFVKNKSPVFPIPVVFMSPQKYFWSRSEQILEMGQKHQNKLFLGQMANFTQTC